MSDISTTKIAAGIAGVTTCYLSYQFHKYCQKDYLEGQSLPGLLGQTMYWYFRETLGLAPSTNMPLFPQDITKEKVEFCLKLQGAIKNTTNIKAIKNIQQIGMGEGVNSTVYKIDLAYTNDDDTNAPTTFVLKLLAHGFEQKMIYRIACVPLNESEFYKSNIAKETGMPVPKCYFVGYEQGRQSFSLMMEDMSHCDGGNANEINGLSVTNAKEALKIIAKFHATYFNKVRGKAPKFIGRGFDSGRFDLLDMVCKQNLNNYINLLKGWEDIGLLRKGTVTDDVTSFLTKYANTSMTTLRLKTLKPKELGGDYNYTLIHGDYRGGNIFIDRNNNDELFIYDFANIHENGIGDDLSWFFASIDEVVFRDNAKELLTTYYDEFISQLKLNNEIDAANKYTFNRFLAECSYGSGQMVMVMMAASEGVLKNIGDNDGNKFIAIREQRAWAYRKMFHTEEMLDLVLANCDKFPKKDEYEKLLPTV